MHNIEYKVVSEKCNKSQIEASINSYVSSQTYREGGHGLYHPIRWIDTVCEDYDAACKYIESHDKHDYDQLAVKYKEYPMPDESKLTKYNELLKKVREAYEAHKNYEEHNHFKDVKSAFIGCPNCKSKINREIYTTKWCAVKANYCPVCREDMRSETMKKKSEALKAKHEKLKQQAQEELDKQQKKLKPEVRYLIKYEYHT